MNEPKLTADTIRILRQVKAHILKEPQTYKHSETVSDCGTMMCVAGHVLSMCKLPMEFPTMEKAAIHLGLSETQAIQLFSPSHKTCLDGFGVNDTLTMFCGLDPKQRAETCARYIDAFIAKHSDPEPVAPVRKVEPFQSLRINIPMTITFSTN